LAEGNVMPTINRIVAIAVLLGLPLCEPSLGQVQNINFHVTAVRLEDAPKVCDDCSATKITVEGYSNTTDYVLECTDVVASKPSPHFTLVCPRVHAGNDYDARLTDTSIWFGPDKPQSSDGPLVGHYDIASEKKVKRQKR
jgi:hypothetical protein